MPLFALLFILGIWGVNHESSRIRSGEIAERFGHDLIVGSFGIAFLAIGATVMWVAVVALIHWITKMKSKTPNKPAHATARTLAAPGR